MDVVVQQAISQHPRAVKIDLVRQDFEVMPAIVVGQKNLLMIVAPLFHVVRQTGDDDSGDPGHGARS